MILDSFVNCMLTFVEAYPEAALAPLAKVVAALCQIFAAAMMKFMMWSSEQSWIGSLSSSLRRGPGDQEDVVDESKA